MRILHTCPDDHIEQMKQYQALGISSFYLRFTIESKEETKKVLQRTQEQMDQWKKKTDCTMTIRFSFTNSFLFDIRSHLSFRFHFHSCRERLTMHRNLNEKQRWSVLLFHAWSYFSHRLFEWMDPPLSDPDRLCICHRKDRKRVHPATLLHLRGSSMCVVNWYRIESVWE